MMDKNSNNEIDEKQENGDASVEQNMRNTSLENDTMTVESQDFHLVVSETSQSTQVTDDKPQKLLVQSSSSNLELKESNSGDKLDDGSNAAIKIVQDGGDIVGDENKIMIEPEKCSGEATPPPSANNDDDENDIVNATPPDQLFSPSSRRLLGMTGSHKRKTDETDEPVAKISRSTDDDIIPETQDCPEGDDEVLPEVMNENTKAEVQNESSGKDDKANSVEKINDTNVINTDNVVQESFQGLSQASENVLDDNAKMEVDEDTMKIEKEVKENANESEAHESVIDEKHPKESLEKINSLEHNDNDGKSHSNAKNSRMSIEVIFDKSLAPPPKPKELVEIDEEGEKIVLDSSHEDPTVNEPDDTAEKKLPINSNLPVGDTKEIVDNKLTNGNKHPKPNKDFQNASTDFVSDSDRSTDSRTDLPIIKKVPELLNIISDSEEDSFMNEEKAKIKMNPVEKEIGIFIKVKCLLHVDEVSKEIVNKEVVSAVCESGESSRLRNYSGLGDISDGKDSVSPGSVTSNPRPYALNPRFSTMSMVSSSSSSSSGSLKLPSKDSVQFSLPRGVPKHAKKPSESQIYDDISEKLKKEWKNVNTLTTSLLNFLNNELLTIDLHNGTVETTNNTSEHFRSSTPEMPKKNSSTMKSSEKVRLTKQTRSQNIRKSRSNGVMQESKPSIEAVEKVREIDEKKKHDGDITTESVSSTSSRQSSRSSTFKNQTPVHDPTDPLVGKHCFAKWGDNNYYPGIIVGRSKTKLRINFLDGLNKLLMEDFVIVITPILPVGLSIYAAVAGDPYGSCGIITSINNTGDTLVYTVETDDREILEVGIRDIFLTTDQVSILKESMNENMTPPSTPKLGKITLDNIVEGSRRNNSPGISTPKSTRSRSKGTPLKKITDVKPSGSGVPSKINFEDGSDSDRKTSDSNISDGEDKGLGTIQSEIIGNSSEFANKGPQNRLKGKGKSKKRVDDQETIALLGPIPEEGSTLFKGFNFILTCASLDLLDRYKNEHKADSNSESGTDLEQDWNKTPFVRERLTQQLTAGGGKVYEKFEDIPVDEYPITKLITNVPNITAKSLQCLSAGIHSWNHKWVIRSCLDNKLVNTNQEKLPAGWSLDRNAYIEMSERPNNKPFNHLIIAVPKIDGIEESTKFWKQIIENAGGTVRLIGNPSENFVEATAVLTNHKCPSWIVQRAQSENIPLLSTSWIIQCLIAGLITSHESQTDYFHYNMK